MPYDVSNRRSGYAVGGVVATGLALWVVQNAVADRRGSVTLAVGSIVFVVLTTLVGGWAGVATGRRASGGGVLYGIVSSWASLVLFAALLGAAEWAGGGKNELQSVTSAFAVLFFGLVPATLLGAGAGYVLSKQVKRGS